MNLLKPQNSGSAYLVESFQHLPSAAVDTHTHFHTYRQDTEGRVGHSGQPESCALSLWEAGADAVFQSPHPFPTFSMVYIGGTIHGDPAPSPSTPPSHPRMQESDLSTAVTPRIVIAVLGAALGSSSNTTADFAWLSYTIVFIHLRQLFWIVSFDPYKNPGRKQLLLPHVKDGGNWGWETGPRPL